MELIILAGLALFILFAATADGGEAEVETFMITRPAPQPQPRTFSRVVITAMLALLIVMVVARMAAVIGQ
jgi:hypothetical protein